MRHFFNNQPKKSHFELLGLLNIEHCRRYDAYYFVIHEIVNKGVKFDNKSYICSDKRFTAKLRLTNFFRSALSF